MSQLIEFYMVYVEGQYQPKFKHNTYADACNEAKRLTRDTGKKAYVLRPEKSYFIKPDFEETTYTEMPF